VLMIGGSMGNKDNLSTEREVVEHCLTVQEHENNWWRGNERDYNGLMTDWVI